MLAAIWLTFAWVNPKLIFQVIYLNKKHNLFKLLKRRDRDRKHSTEPIQLNNRIPIRSTSPIDSPISPQRISTQRPTTTAPIELIPSRKPRTNNTTPPLAQQPSKHDVNNELSKRRRRQRLDPRELLVVSWPYERKPERRPSPRALQNLRPHGEDRRDPSRSLVHKARH